MTLTRSCFPGHIPAVLWPSSISCAVKTSIAVCPTCELVCIVGSQLKRWVAPGEEVSEETEVLPPPPMSRPASSASVSEADAAGEHRCGPLWTGHLLLLQLPTRSLLDLQFVFGKGWLQSSQGCRPD